MKIRNITLRVPPTGQDKVLPKGMPDSAELFTIRQCLTALAKAGVPICGFTLRRRIADGTLKATKTPYRVLVHAKDLDRFITKLKGK